MRTGEYVSTLAEKHQANEVIHLKIGSGVYGVPRWVGNIVNLYGARKAEELNFMYFKQGRHVPAAITVENGMLSEASYRELQEYMNDLEGVENAHKFLLIEAEGIAKEKDLHGGEDITPVSVEIKSLAEILQNDALFLEYDEKAEISCALLSVCRRFIREKLRNTTGLRLIQREKLRRSRCFSQSGKRLSTN